MMPIPEVVDWLQRLPKTSSVGVDEDGLRLYEVTENNELSGLCLELGGIPEEIE